MDFQCSDGRSMLLKYVTNYVTKMNDHNIFQGLTFLSLIFAVGNNAFVLLCKCFWIKFLCHSVYASYYRLQFVYSIFTQKRSSKSIYYQSSSLILMNMSRFQQHCHYN